jgi:hypothetical protein
LSQDLVYPGGSAIVSQQRQVHVVVEPGQQLVQKAKAQAQVGVPIVQVPLLDVGLIEPGGLDLKLGITVRLHCALGLPIELTLDLDQLVAERGIDPLAERDIIDGGGEIGRDLIAGGVLHHGSSPLELQLDHHGLAPGGG